MVAYSFKRQFVDPIRVGLGIQVHHEPGDGHAHPKRQTIRADRKRHARPGEQLQLFCGMRTKNCFLIGRANCIDVQPITFLFGLRGHMGLGIQIGGRRLAPLRIEEFALADGFASIAALVEFWRQEHPAEYAAGAFAGVLIKWEPPR